MKHFETDIDEDTAFYLRGDWLRPTFGHWDCEDPVAHAILDVVEAQHELRDAVCADVTGDNGSNAAIRAAIEKRLAAGDKLMAALLDYENWPDCFDFYFKT
jgi:hypothetical protein